MSVNGISNAYFDNSLLPGVRAGQSVGTHGQGSDFLSSLKMCIADFKSQTVGTLISTSLHTDSTQGALSLGKLLGADNASADPAGLSSAGRNTALFDPESAYGMMTMINAKEVAYKAELSEMGDMKSYLSTMQQEGLKLGSIDAATSNADIEARLRAFADAYNGWIERFDDELQSGGLLAGTQAATVSQWELEQSVENIFNGAEDGLHGMGDLGLTIDPVTNLASLDTTRLNSVMADNKAGVLSAIHDFSANFAKSAELLDSEGNFVPNRMNNLARVIDYIDGNKQALQAEFGQGDAAKPNAQVATALARYNAIHGLAA